MPSGLGNAAHAGAQRPDSTPAASSSGDPGAKNPFTDQLSLDNGHSYNGQIPYHFDPDGTLVDFRIADGHHYRVHRKPDDTTTLPTTKP